jgi:hypothetical protein
MKRCPQCNSVFDDALVYCTNDGTPLLEETFVMPSENLPSDAEEITVIHHDPITIDIPNPNAPPAPTEAFNYQAPPTQTVVPVIVEKPRSSGKNFLYLIAGLLLGGGLVLAAVLFGLFLYQNKTTQTVNVNRTAPTNSPQNVKESPTEAAKTPDAKHETRTDKPDDDFNGRVISLNAYVRASPNRNSKQIDVLPINDRLDIAERENESSPWYRITCEHGTSGWMHGNTIEFTR